MKYMMLVIQSCSGSQSYLQVQIPWGTRAFLGGVCMVFPMSAWVLTRSCIAHDLTVALLFWLNFLNIVLYLTKDSLCEFCPDS